jgi:hypothetical protein
MRGTSSLVAFVLGTALAMGAAFNSQLASAQILVGSVAGGVGPINEYDWSGNAIGSPLASGLSLPIGLAATSSVFYATNNQQGTVAEYNIDGTIIAPTFIQGLTNPIGLLNDNSNHLFVLDADAGTIGEFDATTGHAINPAFITDLDSPRQMATDGTYLYVSIYGGNVSKYDMSGNLIKQYLVGGLNGDGLFGIAVAGPNLYVVGNASNTVGEYNTTTGDPVNPNLIPSLASPEDIVSDGTSLWVANYSTGTVGQYDLSGNPINPTFISNLNGPVALALVPEPSSLCLLGISGVLLLMRRRRTALP